MENLELLTNPIIITLIVIVAIWDAIWKLIGLWKSARNNDLVWFVCIAIFNTVGILPIIYILSKKKKEATNE
jgi:hypothetical protein